MEFSVPLKLTDFLRAYSPLAKLGSTFQYVSRVEDPSVTTYRFETEDQAASVLIGLVKHIADTPTRYVMDLFTRQQPATSMGKHTRPRSQDEPPVQKTNWNNVLACAEKGDRNISIVDWKTESRGRRALLLGGMCSQRHHYGDLTAFLVSVLYRIKGEPLDIGCEVLLRANQYITSPFFVSDFPGVPVQKTLTPFTLALHPASFDLDAYPHAAALRAGELMFPINGHEVVDSLEEESEGAKECELHHSLTQRSVKSKQSLQQISEKLAEAYTVVERLQAESICRKAEAEQEDMKRKEIAMSQEAGKMLVEFASERRLPGEGIVEFFDRMKSAFQMVYPQVDTVSAPSDLPGASAFGKCNLVK